MSEEADRFHVAIGRLSLTVRADDNCEAKFNRALDRMLAESQTMSSALDDSRGPYQ